IRLEAPAREEVWFDAGGVRQAVDNLLSNALKFSPKGREIHVRLWREQERSRLSVADEGPGIPEGERESVFSPFRRLSGDKPGAGLGLAIVREVAQRHGGRVWVEPGLARGATLVLELPGGAPTGRVEPRAMPPPGDRSPDSVARAALPAPPRAG
ncbi:MAG TPA: ATP-binding protein, partial [Myxococcaceae bacterium]|nr:ATP-binding protein [Myxococcaceae bacterium]